MLWRDLAGLLALHTLEDAVDWSSEHSVQPLPLLLVAIPTFWALIDCGLLLRRRFRDGAGNQMLRWI